MFSSQSFILKDKFATCTINLGNSRAFVKQITFTIRVDAYHKINAVLTILGKNVQFSTKSFEVFFSKDDLGYLFFFKSTIPVLFSGSTTFTLTFDSEIIDANIIYKKEKS